MQNNNYQITRNVKSLLSLKEIRGVFNGWVRKLLPTGLDLKDSQLGNQELESSHPAPVNSDAEFLGWERTPKGEIFALYNVIAKQHPLYQSTVSEKTLNQQHLQIPQTPLPPPGQLMRFDHEN